MIEILAFFISRHASFLERYGNVLLIPSIVLILMVDHLIGKRYQKKIRLKWSLRILLFTINGILGSILFMINFPLKPMVTSLAKVQRSVGAHLNDFEFTTIETNKKHLLTEFKGKVVVLNFWATYCKPCLEELPDLEKVQVEYTKDIVVIALSDENQGQIERIAHKLPAQLIIATYSNEKWMNLESFRPVTIILDKTGIIREYKFGRNSKAEFTEMVRKYI